jgi:carbonic anhydrase
VPTEFEPNAADLIAANAAFADDFDKADRVIEPTRRLAIVACMDSRMDIFQILGLENGEAHIIRNAGGVVTDDVIRSLCLSQRTLQTREIVLVHHTDCGLMKVEEGSFRAELEAAYGVTPRWVVEAFTDPFAAVRQSMQRLHITPFVAHKELIRGFVYDVKTGLLHEVES